MKSEIKNKWLIFYWEGRIDTNNAADVEKEILEIYEKNKNLGIIIDAKELTYISSAGLRILMKLRKEAGSVKVIEVSNDIYEIFETTGFTEILEIKKALRNISVEGCKILGKGGNGTVYRLNDETIVKVYRPGLSFEEINCEREYTKAAFVAGIPTSIPFDLVRVGDSYGNVYELMGSDTLSHALISQPERYEELMDKYYDLIKKLGETTVDTNLFSSFKSILLRRCEGLSDIYGEEDAELINSLVSSIRETNTLIHGDLHPGNVMLQGDELMLIDMADLSTGSPIFELASLYRDLGSEKEGETKKHIESSTGMNIEQIKKVWKGLCRRFFETDDESVIQQKLAPYQLVYALNVAIIVSKIPVHMKEELVPSVKKRLVDGVLRPNADKIRHILSTL